MLQFLSFLFLFSGAGQAFSNKDTTIVKHSSKADLCLHAPDSFSPQGSNNIIISIKNNYTAEWTGYLSLELADTKSGKGVDGLFSNIFPNQYFTVSPGDSTETEFPLEAPHQFADAVTVKAKLYDNGIAVDSLVVVLPFKP